MPFSLLRSSLALVLLGTATALELPVYSGLRTNQSAPGVLEVFFKSTTSKVNAMNQEFVSGVGDIVRRLQNDTEIKVVLFKSDVPQYWINHLDLLLEPVDPTLVPRLGELIYNITSLPQATIGVLNGVARGGGGELLSALDMRFATKAHTRIGQPETGGGLVVGAGAGQYLPGLIGRGRAMEYLLSSKDISAGDAERIGWINKAFDSERQMDNYVNELTSRIALFPIVSIRLTKEAVNVRTQVPLSAIQADTARFFEAATNPVTVAVAGKSLEALDNQQPGLNELFLGDYLLSIWQ